MSSRDNLKQLMKKQQLLFDALDTKQYQNKDRRFEGRKSDASSSKFLNNSGFSNENSNLQGSFQTRNHDLSSDRINMSNQRPPVDMSKKVNKANPDLYCQFLQTRNSQRDDATRVQKFINDIFNSNQKSFRSANSSKTSNSPYKQDIRIRQGHSPTNNQTTVSRLYNQIHTKIDSRIKQNTSMEEKIQGPSSTKNLQNHLIQKYLGSNNKKRNDLPAKRMTNQVQPLNKTYNDHSEGLDARPKTEGYHFEEKKQINRKTGTDRNTPVTDKDTTISLTNDSEEKFLPKYTAKAKPKPFPSLSKALEDLPVDKILQQEESVYTILAVIVRKNKVTKLCKTYLGVLTDFNLESLQVLYSDVDQNKILTKSILLERLGVAVILLESLSTADEFDENIQNIKNLLLYIHNNQIQILESLQEKYSSSEKGKSIEQRLSKLQTNKQPLKQKVKMERMSLIKKNNNIISSILTLLIENPNKDYTELERALQSVNQLSLQQGTALVMNCFQKLANQLSQLRLSCDTQQTEKTFDEDIDHPQEEVHPPFLPKRKDEGYTLVLDLDETLVHYQELADGGQFLVRPYAEEFLIDLSQYYELVIFTAALQDYADFILDIIDANNVIKYRLYRQHTTQFHTSTVKDLSLLGRDLSKILIVDNLPENFANQPDNGVYIQSWYGEPEDRALFELAPLLKEIVKKKMPDVRVALRRYRDKMIDNISKGVSEPHLNLSLD